MSNLTRCFSGSNCCKKPNSPEAHQLNHRASASPRSEECCENGTEGENERPRNRNRGCDSDHHSHRRNCQRVIGTSTPTNQVEQVGRKMQNSNEKHPHLYFFFHRSFLLKLFMVYLLWSLKAILMQGFGLRCRFGHLVFSLNLTSLKLFDLTFHLIES